MGTYLTLPIDTNLASMGGRFAFSTNVGDNTYQFEFWYCAEGEFWELFIFKPEDGTKLFHSKVVYGMQELVDDYFWLSFGDPQQLATTVDRFTLGSQVIAAVGLDG